MYTFFLLSVGPIHVSTSVSKMDDVAKEVSYEFNGWVRNGGRWKPTECRARVKVRCQNEDVNGVNGQVLSQCKRLKRH